MEELSTDVTQPDPAPLDGVVMEFVDRLPVLNFKSFIFLFN